MLLILNQPRFYTPNPSRATRIRSRAQSSPPSQSRRPDPPIIDKGKRPQTDQDEKDETTEVVDVLIFGIVFLLEHQIRLKATQTLKRLMNNVADLREKIEW